VLAQYVEDDGDIRTQRTWLRGMQTQRPALLLNFAHRSATTFEISLPPGTTQEMEIAYYPSAYSLRGLVKDRVGNAEPLTDFPGCKNSEEVLDAYAESLGQSPWVDRFPMAICKIVPLRIGGEFQLCDSNQKVLPTRISDEAGWQMIAISGGNEISVFGEWDGIAIRPLSLMSNSKYHSLTS